MGKEEPKADLHARIFTTEAKTQDKSSLHQAGSDQETEFREERKKENTVCTYIHTLLTNKQTTNNKQRKTRVNLVIPEDLDEALEIMAPLFHTTKSDLATEGLLKHLEFLASKLPEKIALTVVQQPLALADQEPDSMLDLEVDLMRDQLKPPVDKLKKIKPTPEWHDSSKTWVSRDTIRKLLPQAIRLVRRSKDPELERLVCEARELLRM